MRNIADDIIVYGKTHEQHDINSTEGNISIKKIAVSLVEQIYSAICTQPVPVRVKDLRDAPKWTSVHEMRSLLGTAK